MAPPAREFRLRPKARLDLEEIWSYTAGHWSRHQVDSYYSRIVEAVNALAFGRVKGRPVDHIRIGCFKYPLGSHFIFFKLADCGVDVIRVLHQRMDVSRHL